MRLTLRGKLSVIVGTATLAFLVIIVAGSLTLRRSERELGRIEAVYLPKVELRPQLEAQLERMQHAYQDAVAARDEDAMAATREARDTFLGLLDGAGQAIERAQAVALRAAVQDYDRSASDVSRRLVAGETGEPLVAAMGAMQQKRLHVLELLRGATAFERGELARAFAETNRSMETSATIRLVVAVGCLLLVIALATWMARGILATMRSLTLGLERFGAGDFGHPIAVSSRDELGDVAVRANEMAARLRRMAEERDRGDWLKAGVAGLVQELRGELTPDELGARAARFIANTLGAPAAALYIAEDDGTLVLAGETEVKGGAVRRFAPGEGLVGRAAQQEDLKVIEAPPPDYLRVRSGLGEAAPRALVFLPLSHAGRVTGVLEVATFKPWSELWSELLLSTRESLAIAIVVARGRAATRELLVATQRQAARLAAQEEELRSTNDELQAQEEELRQANTDLSRQTEELEARRRLLAERNADLDDVRVRLEQRAAELATVSTYKSQFLANMSHELRTPLNSMLLLSNLLAENEGGALSPKQVEYARTIHGAGRDLLGLINQVLDLAKVESGRQEVELASVPLGDVVAQLERIFAPLAREKGLGFSATIADDVPEAIVTDRRRLEQILTNFLGNAMKFTSRGQVTFRIAWAGPTIQFRRPELAETGALAFSVTDTGLGIAAGDQERVFAPFEQVDGASDRRYGGTGLGLGIARELATLLGGELQLTSALGQGSTFTCLLPPSRQPARRAEDGAAAPAAEPAGLVESGAPFLLLIEDDPIFATTFGDVITSQGLRYVQARSGQAGLRIARERRPSGIILDIKLPDTDGWLVMEALRADSATAHIPVHFVSALDGAERGLALGAVGYLRKPVGRQDLLDVIEALVPRGSARVPRVLVVEDDALTASSVLRMLEAEALEAKRVSTAEQALETLREERFACMILDLSLPEMSGLDLLRTLRDASVPEPPRVVVYTARSLSRAETVMIEAYAEAVVVKDGSSVERLLDEVKLFVRRFDGARRGQRAPVPAAPLPEARFEGCKVLLADDDMRTVYALSATLRAKGIEVVVAENGRAAVEVLDAQPDVAVVLMDIMMPEMDGYEAMRRIRADGRFGALPIVALTAKAMKGDEERCVEAGATHYLPKPVDAGRLITLLQTCLARAEAPRLD